MDSSRRAEPWGAVMQAPEPGVHTEASRTVKKPGLAKKFKRGMQKLIRRFSCSAPAVVPVAAPTTPRHAPPPVEDTLSQVAVKVEGLKEMAHNAYYQALTRGVHLEALQQKAERLEDEATEYAKVCRKHANRWSNREMLAAAVGVVAVGAIVWRVFPPRLPR
ncbi:hypothetical protein HYH02_009888 [Chlamydomonas schloesseri]|uniref:V-SNARE coiled-coil homology domain-containing protein n=1 Tax=Chlamydomonas schloesseri TaxID=2026947 RepID=A0A835W6K5_9CHLO|nr:hypothetical protein HYH02_009888 [Chlamydomonas schloesseri]|eukprot:KAG2441295.1 hypothetical protein HYH02_009888 [Chlamydomonas schloesseri]